MQKLLNATKHEIINLVDQGKIINWKNRSYRVLNENGQYIILYSDNKYKLTLDSEFTDSDTNSYFFEGEELKTYYQAFLNQNEESISVSKTEKYSRPSGNYFDSKDEAIAHFTIALNEARTRFITIKENYLKFCQENRVSINYQLDGDTHGLIDYMYMSVESNGYHIEFKID